MIAVEREILKNEVAVVTCLLKELNYSYAECTAILNVRRCKCSSNIVNKKRFISIYTTAGR
jgi:hypothetical protein